VWIYDIIYNYGFHSSRKKPPLIISANVDVRMDLWVKLLIYKKYYVLERRNINESFKT